MSCVVVFLVVLVFFFFLSHVCTATATVTVRVGERVIVNGDYSGLRNMMQQACRVGIAGPAGVFLALTQPADNRP